MPAFTRQSDVIYGRRAGLALTMEVLTPPERNGLGVIWVVSSSGVSSPDQTFQSSFLGVAAPLLRHGYTVFAPVHGSAPRFQIENFVQDVRRAVRWVRHHEERFQIDGNRLAIAGSSSGGYLALMVALADNRISHESPDPVEHESGRVQAVLGFFPPSDLVNFGGPSEDVVSFLQRKHEVVDPSFRFFEVDAKGARILIEDSGQVLERLHEMSPVEHVTRDDPPVFLVHGDRDEIVPLEQSQRLRGRLQNAGVDATLVIREGMGHAWPNWENETELMAEWLDGLFSSGHTPDGVLGGILDRVASIRERWAVPGLAVAVIQDDDLVFQQEFGLRDVEAMLPVTPRTVFRIGSATKSFTSALATVLAKEGLFDLDASVTDLTPEIRLWDRSLSRQLTMRDLLSHTSGLATSWDLAWILSRLDRRELARRLRFLPAESSPGEVFRYSNTGYAAAGIVLEELSGLNWEELLTQRILKPLGMEHTGFGAPHAMSPENHALPYRTLRTGPIRISDSEVAFRQVDVLGPAGSMISNLDDMVRWLRAQLRAAAGDADLPLDAAVLAAGHESTVSVGSAYGTIMQADAYGMGWAVGEHRGYQVIEHAGNIEGFSSLVSMIPEQNMGVVVLSNSMNLAAYPISRTAYDLLLGHEPDDWSSPLEDLWVQMEEARTGSAKLPPSDPSASPSMPLASYVAAYHHPFFGQAAVDQANEMLSLTFESGIGGELHPIGGDSFKVILEEFYLPSVEIEFQVAPDEGVRGMEVLLQPGSEPVVFSRDLDRRSEHGRL